MVIIVKMIRLTILFSIIFIISGCSNDGLGQQRKPDYLEVFRAFQKTDMYEKCRSFQEEIWKKPHDTHWQTRPYKTDLDMNIDSSSIIDNVYVANLSCVVHATYSLSATTYINESYEMDAGTITID